MALPKDLCGTESVLQRNAAWLLAIITTFGFIHVAAERSFGRGGIRHGVRHAHKSAALADAADVLREVANYGPEKEEQLCQLIGNQERVSLTLAWADRLRLVQFGEKGWEVDPVIKRVLLAPES